MTITFFCMTRECYGPWHFDDMPDVDTKKKYVRVGLEKVDSTYLKN